MKYLIKTFVLVVAMTLNSYAGPNASGGIPETAYEHTRTAIRSILENAEVTHLLVHAGGIEGIDAIKDENDVFVIRTEKCQIFAKFSRVFSASQFGLPQFKEVIEILNDRTIGSCK